MILIFWVIVIVRVFFFIFSFSIFLIYIWLADFSIFNLFVSKNLKRHSCYFEHLFFFPDFKSLLRNLLISINYWKSEHIDVPVKITSHHLLEFLLNRFCVEKHTLHSFALSFEIIEL